jgi:protein-L-isoaspartate(D-aspartate) O-methyltransferase
MDFTTARTRLIDNLGSEIADKRVLAAMSRIPRELFVPAPSRHLAYEDIPLPIGLEQTISQPFIIALMTQALALTGVETVLEIGTGSGYQTAVLAELARLVVTVERLPALSATARKVLDDQGYRNIEMHSATETLGWPDGAPYHAILVTAGAPRVPPDLLAQLALGGRLVIPVGTRHVQELQKFTRREKKNLVENLGGCRFVSLIGKSAWEEAENG